MKEEYIELNDVVSWVFSLAKVSFMKKLIILIVSVIIILGGYRYYEAKNSDVLFNYGIHPFEENAVVEEINSDNREITVFIKDSDTYLKSEKNPYEDKEIKLNFISDF